MNNDTVRLVCNNCKSGDKWEIINDCGILVAVCQCGNMVVIKTSFNNKIENDTTILQ
jgi:hypothetical protein